MKNLKILSYNIHKGFGPGRSKYNLHGIREELRKQKPDLIFLQEIGDHEKHGHGAQFEFISEKFWPHFSYGKNAIYTKGHHGNAILSKHPIISSVNQNISKNRWEKRGLLHAIIQISKDRPHIHCMCVHLNLFEGSRMKQLQDLCMRIEREVGPKEPLIVAGDFNDWQERASEPLRDIFNLKEAFVETYGNHAQTFPSFFPFMALDRIYYRGFEVRKCQILEGPAWEKLSDHIPIEAELKFD